MWFLVTKYAVTAFVIVLATELAKRSDKLGALIVSLPFVTILTLVWMNLEKQGSEKVANHAFYTFWYVIPTLPMFLLFPWMIKKGINFWICLGASLLLTAALLIITHLLLRKYDIHLL